MIDRRPTLIYPGHPTLYERLFRKSAVEKRTLFTNLLQKHQEELEQENKQVVIVPVQATNRVFDPRK